MLAEGNEFQFFYDYFSDLPDDGPEIRGGQPRYNIGDTVNVTCISRNSLPAAKLSWYINGEKADPIYLRTYPEETNIRTQLQTSTLGLTFKVNTRQTWIDQILTFQRAFQIVKALRLVNFVL